MLKNFKFQKLNLNNHFANTFLEIIFYRNEMECNAHVYVSAFFDWGYILDLDNSGVFQTHQYKEFCIFFNKNKMLKKIKLPAKKIWDDWQLTAQNCHLDFQYYYVSV